MPQLLAGGPSGLLTCPSRPPGAQAKDHTHRTLTLYDALTMDDAIFFGGGMNEQGDSRSRMGQKIVIQALSLSNVYSSSIIFFKSVM